MTRSGRNFLEVSLPATSRDSIHPDKTGNRKGSTLHTEETELMNDKLPPCADTRVERVRLKVPFLCPMSAIFGVLTVNSGFVGKSLIY
jgi:hypothetical protein